ncbi:MAG: hypothetical protein JO362_19770 [Streptomycetaceae bacterium]|nr:hypothetical protein [Streptomycetaceae bacterium]
MLALLVLISMAAAEGLGFVTRHVGHQLFHGVNPTVSAAIVAAMSTTVVAIGTLVLGRFFEKQKAIETQIREKKIPIYSRLVSGLFGLLNASGDSERQAAATDLFQTITPEIIAWASDEVLVAWSRFKRKVPTLPQEEQVFLLEELLAAIRKDFGHKGIAVKKGDLLGLFITDIDQVLANRRRSPSRRNQVSVPSVSEETPHTSA